MELVRFLLGGRIQRLLLSWGCRLRNHSVDTGGLMLFNFCEDCFTGWSTKDEKCLALFTQMSMNENPAISILVQATNSTVGVWLLCVGDRRRETRFYSPSNFLRSFFVIVSPVSF
jgi:hypothetical protein